MFRVVLNKINNLLEEAYHFHYQDSEQNPWYKNLVKLEVLITALYERIFMPQDQKAKLISDNTAILEKEFNEIISKNEENKYSDQKVAAYFVSKMDPNGVFFDTTGMINHFYEIKNLQAHGYTVYPYLIKNLFEIKHNHIFHPINLLYINAHGSETGLYIDYFDIKQNLTFLDLAQDADILLNSCSTGKGLESSIAAKIANDNPGTQVFGASKNVFAAIINFAVEEGEYFIESVEYQITGIFFPSPIEDTMHKFLGISLLQESY